MTQASAPIEDLLRKINREAGPQDDLNTWLKRRIDSAKKLTSSKEELAKVMAFDLNYTMEHGQPFTEV